MTPLILLFILSIVSFFIGIHLFKKLGKFWIFIIFLILYLLILNYGIENDSKNYEFNYVCCVYPVNPFLKISDLKKGLIKIKKRKTGLVFSAVKYQFPFFRSFIVSKKKIKMIFKKYYKKRSQDLKQIFCDAGQFYWGSKNTWLKEKMLFSKNSDIIIIPKWRYHDIDTLDDWKKAEKIIDIDLK